MRRVNMERFKIPGIRELALVLFSVASIGLSAQSFIHTPGVSYVDTKIEYSYDDTEKVINLTIFWKKGELYGREVNGERVEIANANMRYNIHVEPGVEIPQLVGGLVGDPGKNVTVTRNADAKFVTEVTANFSASEELVNKLPDGYTARAFGVSIEASPVWGDYFPPRFIYDLPGPDDDFVAVAYVKIPVTSGTPTEATKFIQRSEPYYGLKATGNGAGVMDEGSFWSATKGFVGQGFYPAEWEPDDSNYWVGFDAYKTPEGKYLWSNANNWSKGELPQTGDKVVYRADANDLWVDVVETISGITNNGTSKNLIIDTNGGLEITTDDIVIAGAGIYVRAEDPDLANSKNGAFIVPEHYQVQADVELYTKGVGPESATKVDEMHWQYFGIPVKTFPASKMHGAYIRRYDETNTVYKDIGEGNTHIYYWHWLDNSSVMSPVTGYEISRKESHGGLFYFAGELNTADIDTVLTITDSGYFKGQHVLSNPYSAGLNIRNGLVFGSGLKKTVYLFNTGTPLHWQDGIDADDHFGDAKGQFVAVPQEHADALTTQIASMQGFVVHADTIQKNSTNLQRTLTFKYKAGTSLTNSAMYAPEQEEKIFSRISLSSGDKLKDRVWLFTEANSTRRFDNGYDGYKMVGAANLAQLYAWEQDGNYQVNTVPDINSTYLGFKAEEGTENYTMTFNHTNLDKKYLAVFLSDLVTGVTKDVTEEGASYSFTATNQTVADRRFVLSTIERSGVEESGKISVYQNSGTVFISNCFDERVYVYIYNAAGMMVKKLEMNPLSNVSFSEAKFSPGVYTLRMDVENNKEVAGKIIIK